MIEVVARNATDKDVLYSKFSDMEPTKPQWMIDQDEENAAKEAHEKRILRSLASTDSMEENASLTIESPKWETIVELNKNNLLSYL